MPVELKPGDYVKLREDLPTGDLQSVGHVGQVVDRQPNLGTHVFVRFSNDREIGFAKGLLIKVANPAGTIASDDLNASNDE